MPEEIELRAFSSRYYGLLERWLAAPHVAPWFPEPAEHLAWALSPPPGGNQALIVIGGEPVGYIRWQSVFRSALDAVGLGEIPANSVDVDLLIGEPSFVRCGPSPGPMPITSATGKASPRP